MVRQKLVTIVIASIRRLQALAVAKRAKRKRNEVQMTRAALFSRWLLAGQVESSTRTPESICGDHLTSQR